MIEITKDTDKLITFSTDMHSIENLFEFTVNREIPEEIAQKQALVNAFDDDLKRYKKNVEQKQQEIKQLQEKIVEYEKIKRMWIKEADKARNKLKIYEAFHTQMKTVMEGIK